MCSDNVPLEVSMPLATSNRILPLALAAITVTLLGCGPAAEPPPTFHPSTPAEAAALNHFDTAVKPVLRQNCYRCHAGMNHKGGFNLSTRELLLKGGESDKVVVVPGHPEQSLLLQLIKHQGPAGPNGHPGPMPPKGQLSSDEIAAISKWIADGAVMDR
ncbi:Planctomycete cytochrome C [Terriglobus roseus]|uniref:Planctomycete cytochrome C n=2 Tax=Terriglobus roseus TaxID=392734 RepID=A0A1H4M2P0_9BACT|nr:Planctomycete cytochrome C [Terriglobus roseus]